jgi:hypothetical protein
MRVSCQLPNTTPQYIYALHLIKIIYLDNLSIQLFNTTPKHNY